MITALCMLIGAIIVIVTRKSMARASTITAASFYVVGSFIAYIGAGSCSDLKIWGFISLAFGYVFLVSILRSRKQILIWSIIAVLFLIFLMSGGEGEGEVNTAVNSRDREQFVEIMIGYKIM